MAVMADGSFPFGAVGLVHIENRSPSTGRIGIDEELTLTGPPDRPRSRTPRAAPSASLTEAWVGRQKAWEETQHDAAPRRRRGDPARKRPTATATADELPVQRRVAARRRPRPPLRRGLRRPQPDPHARADREAARLPSGRSRTGCGPRPAAWRRSRAASPTPSRVDVSFRKPIFLPGRVEFAERRGRGDRLRGARRKATDPPPRRPRQAGRGQNQNREEAATVNENGNTASVADRSMGFGLRALNRSPARACSTGSASASRSSGSSSRTTKSGFRSATAAGRTFKAAQQLGKPARQKTGKSTRPVRPHPRRRAADVPGGGARLRRGEGPPRRARGRRRAATTPPELLAQANELGVNMLGVPEELGGVMHEQAAVDQRPDRRGARPRRHGHRLRGPRPRRRRHRDRPLGHAPSRRRPTCPPSPARTSPPPRWRSSSRGRSSTR